MSETLRTVRVTFDAMPEALALMEGEDARLESWRAGHRRSYQRAGILAPDMELIWEEFRMVEDFGGEAAR